MAKIELLRITEAAKARIAVLVQRAPKGAVGLRISIDKAGCSGYKYEISYAFEKRNFEEEVACDGATVLIAPEALMSIIGSTMDYKETKLKSGFDFINPNEKGRCGCGESFML